MPIRNTWGVLKYGVGERTGHISWTDRVKND